MVLVEFHHVAAIVQSKLTHGIAILIVGKLNRVVVKINFHTITVKLARVWIILTTNQSGVQEMALVCYSVIRHKIIRGNPHSSLVFPSINWKAVNIEFLSLSFTSIIYVRSFKGDYTITILRSFAFSLS